jgi:hypothetical protein
MSEVISFSVGGNGGYQVGGPVGLNQSITGTGCNRVFN